MRDEEDDDAENIINEDQEAMIPDQKLPPGNLWTRLIDLENFAINNVPIYSIDEDTENFKYETKDSSSFIE